MENLTKNDIIEILKREPPVKALVEESHTLCIGDFGKKLLHQVSGIEEKLFPDLVKPKGRRGKFMIRGTTGNLFINYEVKLEGEKLMLEIFFVKDATHMDSGAEQTIKLSTQELQYGTRYYFTCDCGRKCNKLYLPKNSLFVCRICSELAYESTRINKKSLGGLPYYVHKRIKLAKLRESMDRISYNGRPTKRAIRFFRQWNNLEESYNADIKSLANKQFAEAVLTS